MLSALSNLIAPDRLRCYLNKVDLPTSVKTLQTLWDYRRKHREREEWVPNAEGR